MYNTSEQNNTKELINYLKEESRSKHEEIKSIIELTKTEILAIDKTIKTEIGKVDNTIKTEMIDIKNRYELFGALMVFLSALITGLTTNSIISPLNFSNEVKSSLTLLATIVSAIVLFSIWHYTHRK